MAQTAPLIPRLVASSIAIANRAGEIIRNVMSKGDLGIVEKTGKNDLQTEADRSAQRCIITSLSKQFPSITIIGEEDEPSDSPVPSDWVVSEVDQDILRLECPDNLQQVSAEEVVVWVDPLDGTSEYTQGLLDHVTVLIGIAVGNRSVAGVIHQPYYNYQKENEPLGRTIWGIRGVGVGGFEPKAAPEGQRIITTTRSHSTPEVQATLDAMKPDNILRVGGAGHKVMLLIEGKAHAYVFASAGCKRWDTCAPEAILVALGGKLTDMHGKEYSYDKNTPFPNKGGVLATGKGENHEWYLEKVPEAIRKKLV
ncbi:hypothetical protein R5R35_001996 [Gryllus longicercus]|uniref:3'(2'),5'-bisphosphate nucleotidase 1 n=1 Tax=Gryllus longicercus TaxID=2509291 RepID=A0AAN9VG11_9ORTH|nr:Putative inositol monophosphatase 3 [Gryllus bimaculatus]